MIISHKYRFIFLHCRKVAGSAIKAAIWPILGPDDIVIGSLHEIYRRYGSVNRATRNSILHPYAWLGLLRGGASSLVRRRDVGGMINLAVKHRFRPLLGDNPVHPPATAIAAALPHIWNTYYKFCFVRNPYSQVLSDYYFRCRARRSRPIPFSAFVEYLAAGSSPAALGPCAATSNWKQYTINDAIAVDYIGRYETLQRDLDNVLATLGIPRIRLTIREKVGSYDRERLADYYGAKERTLVAMLYRNEINTFGYTLPTNATSHAHLVAGSAPKHLAPNGG